MSSKNNSTIRIPKGNVTYDGNIILSVINLATKEIAGVSSLVTNFGSKIKMFFNKNFKEGVKVNYNNNSLIVDVYVNVYYGYNVSEIACKIQENIKNSIASMMEINIDKINVHFLGVDFATEEDY